MIVVVVVCWVGQTKRAPGEESWGMMTTFIRTVTAIQDQLKIRSTSYRYDTCPRFSPTPLGLYEGLNT